MIKHIITYKKLGLFGEPVTHTHIVTDDYVAFVAINNAKRQGAFDVTMTDMDTDEPDTL